MAATSYHRIAGQDPAHVAALGDGIFAVAMTLLVLDLRVPVESATHGHHGLLHALGDLGPQAAAYGLSFLTLGMFWIGMHTTLGFVARGNRAFTWLVLAFLLAVTVMPFSTSLLAEFIDHRLAIGVYWLNLLLLGATQLGYVLHARRNDLLRSDLPSDGIATMQRRIGVAQALYAIAALLCLVDTRLSIGLLVVLQLNSAAPIPLPPFNRY